MVLDLVTGGLGEGVAGTRVPPSADPGERPGAIRVVGSPLRVSGPPGGPHRYPPPLGADTDAVLRDDLGLSDDEIAALRAAKAVQ
jgi:crotonobetainyl-CoA:carnitine CoA-transferase CaiB-like acyl-CoA transferase